MINSSYYREMPNVMKKNLIIIKSIIENFSQKII